MGFFTKPSNKNNADGTDKWRDKYLNLLDTHEQFEKNQKEQQELLCKLVIRLSLATSGVDPQLEPYLQRIRDHLTGLPNRLAYDDRRNYEIAHWLRYRTPLYVVIWDIDFFKKINDKFGHQMGDKVLIHVARQLSDNIRKTDFIARIGGEEFVMLMPNTKSFRPSKSRNICAILLNRTS